MRDIIIAVQAVLLVGFIAVYVVRESNADTRLRRVEDRVAATEDVGAKLAHRLADHEPRLVDLEQAEAGRTVDAARASRRKVDAIRAAEADPARFVRVESLSLESSGGWSPRTRLGSAVFTNSSDTRVSALQGTIVYKCCNGQVTGRSAVAFDGMIPPHSTATLPAHAEWIEYNADAPISELTITNAVAAAE